jgi:hypothetical protein
MTHVRARGGMFASALLGCLVSGCVSPGGGGGMLSGGPGGYPDYEREREYEEEREWEARQHQHYACSEIGERIAFDRQKIDEIAPTGRHKKALQWYRDDLENARRDSAGCRDYRWEERRREEEAWHERREEDRERREAQREQCDRIEDRIRFDRAKIAEIDPTGRHQKAEQWYRDDLRNAERDLSRCRGR